METTPSFVEFCGTILFACGVLHSFFTARILKFSHRFSADSWISGVLHLLGEIEVVFGVWAAVFFVFFAFQEGFAPVIHYQESLDFTEPLFVFVVMVISASKPVLWAAERSLQWVSHGIHRFLRTPPQFTDLFVLLSVGPLAGSLITEPAAMTVTALMLKDRWSQHPRRLMHALLAVLFVNVSIGGALTPFAAPPILMVAKTWGWDLPTVFNLLGRKCILAVVINSFLLLVVFRKEIARVFQSRSTKGSETRSVEMPLALVGLHFLFLLGVIASSHHSQVFFGLFLFFLGVTKATNRYQSQLRFRESLLVAFFLGGIIVFGAFQKWWLQLLLTGMSEKVLYWGTVALTAVTDNSALTYLGSQVENLSEVSRYFLVAGALTGGGLTIIANAPNAAGASLLSDLFEDRAVHPGLLFLMALGPTLVTAVLLGTGP